jgi:alpha-acetolactate decarboxylase
MNAKKYVERFEQQRKKHQQAMEMWNKKTHYGTMTTLNDETKEKLRRSSSSRKTKKDLSSRMEEQNNFLLFLAKEKEKEKELIGD